MRLTEEIPADSGSDLLCYLLSGGVSGRMSSGAFARGEPVIVVEVGFEVRVFPRVHQFRDPGAPLKGPTTAAVIHPP